MAVLLLYSNLAFLIWGFTSPLAAPPKQVPVGTQFYEDIVIDENSTTQDERSLSVFFFIYTDKQCLTRALSSSGAVQIGSLESGCSRLSGFFQISLLFKSLRQMLTSLICFIMSGNELEIRFRSFAASDHFKSHWANIQTWEIEFLYNLCQKTDAKLENKVEMSVAEPSFHSVLVLCQILFKFPSLSLCWIRIINSPDTLWKVIKSVLWQYVN